MSHPSFMTIALLSLLTLMGSESWGKDWKPYQATKNGDIYYFDPESVENLPKGRVKVWVKTEKTDFSGQDLKNHINEVLSGKKGKVTGEIIQLFEINCPEQKFRIINLAVYDKTKEIKEYYNDPSEWDVIAPESVTHFLHHEVCR